MICEEKTAQPKQQTDTKSEINTLTLAATASHALSAASPRTDIDDSGVCSILDVENGDGLEEFASKRRFEEEGQIRVSKRMNDADVAARESEIQRRDAARLAHLEEQRHFAQVGQHQTLAVHVHVEKLTEVDVLLRDFKR